MSDCKRVGLRGDEKAHHGTFAIVDERRDEEMHSVCDCGPSTNVVPL